MIAHLIFVLKHVIFKNLQCSLHLNLPNISVGLQIYICMYIVLAAKVLCLLTRDASWTQQVPFQMI